MVVTSEALVIFLLLYLVHTVNVQLFQVFGCGKTRFSVICHNAAVTSAM